MIGYVIDLIGESVEEHIGGKPISRWISLGKAHGTPEDEVKDHISKLVDCNGGGSQVYRFISARDVSDIDVDEIGNHWTFKKSESMRSVLDDDFDDDVHRDLYLLVGISLKGSVDFRKSMVQFVQLSGEQEVNFVYGKTPKLVDILKWDGKIFIKQDKSKAVGKFVPRLGRDDWDEP